MGFFLVELFVVIVVSGEIQVREVFNSVDNQHAPRMVLVIIYFNCDSTDILPGSFSQKVINKLRPERCAVPAELNAVAFLLLSIIRLDRLLDLRCPVIPGYMKIVYAIECGCRIQEEDCLGVVILSVSFDGIFRLLDSTWVFLH